MSTIADHEWEALSRAAREGVQRRREAGEREFVVQGRVTAEAPLRHDPEPFSPDMLVGIRAGAEQIVEAVRDGEAHDAAHTYPELAWVPEVRELRTWVVTKHHRRTVHDWQIREWRTGPISEYLDVPDHQATMVGLFAADADVSVSGASDMEMHVLAPDYSVDRWLGRRPVTKAECDWGSHSYIFTAAAAKYDMHCTGRASEYLVLSQGAVLVAAATCAGCLAWLRAGGSLDSA